MAPKSDAGARKRDLATVQEVAEYLHKSPSTLYYWRWRGIGPRGSKVGTTVMYRWADVDRWLDEQAGASV